MSWLVWYVIIIRNIFLVITCSTSFVSLFVDSLVFFWSWKRCWLVLLLFFLWEIIIFIRVIKEISFVFSGIMFWLLLFFWLFDNGFWLFCWSCYHLWDLNFFSGNIFIAVVIVAFKKMIAFMFWWWILNWSNLFIVTIILNGSCILDNFINRWLRHIFSFVIIIIIIQWFLY